VGGSLLLLWYVAGAMWVAPHFLSYFNEIAGGASGGSRYLADSNIDWGQDLDELGRYCRSRGIVKIKLSYFGTASPETAGVPYLMLPSVTSGWKTRSSANSVEAGDVVAVSVTNLRRVYFRNPEDFPIRVDLPGRSGWMGFGSFLAYLDEHYRPFGRAGYSILIFKLTPEYER
jgi:hypothetical protein